MVGGNLGRMWTALFIGLVVFLAAPLAHATVYGWRGEGGVFMLSNDAKDVPEAQRPTIIAAAEEGLRPVLYRAGEWFADYRRLRVVAVKG